MKTYSKSKQPSNLSLAFGSSSSSSVLFLDAATVGNENIANPQPVAKAVVKPRSHTIDLSSTGQKPKKARTAKLSIDEVIKEGKLEHCKYLLSKIEAFVNSPIPLHELGVKLDSEWILDVELSSWLLALQFVQSTLHSFYLPESAIKDLHEKLKRRCLSHTIAPLSISRFAGDSFSFPREPHSGEETPAGDRTPFFDVQIRPLDSSRSIAQRASTPSSEYLAKGLHELKMNSNSPQNVVPSVFSFSDAVESVGVPLTEDSVSTKLNMQIEAMDFADSHHNSNSNDVDISNEDHDDLSVHTAATEQDVEFDDLPGLTQHTCLDKGFPDESNQTPPLSPIHAGNRTTVLGHGHVQFNNAFNKTHEYEMKTDADIFPDSSSKPSQFMGSGVRGNRMFASPGCPPPLRRAFTEPMQSSFAAKIDRCDATPMPQSQPCSLAHMQTPVILATDNFSQFVESTMVADAFLEKLKSRLVQRLSERKAAAGKDDARHDKALPAQSGKLPKRIATLPYDMGKNTLMLGLPPSDNDNWSAGLDCHSFHARDSFPPSELKNVSRRVPDQSLFNDHAAISDISLTLSPQQQWGAFGKSSCPDGSPVNSPSFCSKDRAKRNLMFSLAKMKRVTMSARKANSRRNRVDNESDMDWNYYGAPNQLDLSDSSVADGHIAPYRESRVSMSPTQRLCPLSMSMSPSAESMSHLEADHHLHCRFPQEYSLLVDGESIQAIPGITLAPVDSSQVNSSLFSNNDSRLLNAASVPSKFLGPTSNIVGGRFTSTFQGGAPVVNAPSQFEERVVRVESVALNNNLSLEIVDRNGQHRYEILSSHWKITSCCPVGFLVWDDDGSGINTVYYLPKHPLKWNTLNEPEEIVDIARIQRLRHQARRGSLFCTENEMFDQFYGSEGTTDANREDDDFLLPPTAIKRSTMHQSPSPAEITELSQLNESAITIDEEEDEQAVRVRLLNLDVCLGSPKEVSRRYFQLLPSIVRDVIFSYLAHDDMKTLVRVCKSIALSAFVSLSQSSSSLRTTDCDCKVTSSHSSQLETLLTHYPEASFLSEGACKKVYKVTSRKLQNNDDIRAVSVMDIADLRERDIADAVDAELRVSVLCSALCVLRICPLFVKVYNVFRSSENVFERPKAKASRSLTTLPQQLLRADNAGPAKCQYISMEFCTGGDLEYHVRQLSEQWKKKSQLVDKKGRANGEFLAHNRDAPLSVALIRTLFFQMCFSLYSGRESLSLRHFDIKLLNFFITEPSESQFGLNDAILVGFGKFVFRLPLKINNCNSIVKLADFGTSAVGNEQLHDHVTPQQFTTLENTPPEFLILGSGARQSHAADSFCLGLCFLHLLAGEEPYEVHLQDVRCPAEVLQKLQRVWHIGSVGKFSKSPFVVVRDVIHTLESSDDDAYPISEVFAHTLYRYLVMLVSSPSFRESFLENDLFKHSDVWRTLVESLDLRRIVDNLSGISSRSRKRDSPAVARFEADISQWSINVGVHPVMVRVRRQLDSLGEGAERLLFGLLSWDPALRCTMHDTLHSPVFVSLRHFDSTAQCSLQHFMHYFRENDDLPIF